MVVQWTSTQSNVIIEIMDAQGGIVARTEDARKLIYERSPNDDVLHIIVRASDGNVLAKRMC